jgi:hypothetical protein
MGLGGLFSVRNGIPSGWLWQQIVEDVQTVEALMPRLEATQEFRNRYGVLLELRERRARGEVVDVPTMAELRNYEVVVEQTLRSLGLPPQSWSLQRIHNLVRNQLSAVEVEQRASLAVEWVMTAPPSVRQAFDEFYGAGQGSAALAAYFLDPDLGQQMLTEQVRTAYVRGLGKEFGLNLDKARSGQLAKLPMTKSGYATDFGAVAQYGDVTRERFGETRDMTLEGEGIDAVMFGDADASGSLNRRVLERQRVNRAGQGGAALTQEGVTGLRSL